MTESFYIDPDYDVVRCPSELHPESYGVEIRLPGGIKAPQISYELLGFKLGEEGKEQGFKGRFHHAINLVRMIWGTDKKSKVCITKKHRITAGPRKGEWVQVHNNYFLDALRALCESDMQEHPEYGPYPDAVGFTGCASSGKTFSASVYLLLCFYSQPNKFTGIISTTSGAGADRRIWGDVKSLHDAGIYGEREEFRVIEYLKSLIYMPDKDVLGGKAKLRDLRNGICVVPIARGKEGEPALAAIMGMKNEFVAWAIDELPAMDDNVMRPRSNLESNNRFQFIGVGNASSRTDPHGQLLEPLDGWAGVDQHSRKWFAKTCVAYFFHGAASPNFHPAVNQKSRYKHTFPYPYLSNRINMDSIAISNSSVRDIDTGRKTLDYIRFAIGFWPEGDALNTVLTPGIVRSNSAHEAAVSWSAEPLIAIAAFDPAFTSNGDKSELAIGHLGVTIHGRNMLLLPDETKTINPPVTKDNESFRQSTAQEVVRLCRVAGVLPENFFMDAGGDGGLMVSEIIKDWIKYDPTAAEIKTLTSIAKLTDKSRYSDRVTRYWYRMVDAIRSGSIRGFNVSSRYAREFFERRYEAMGDRKVRVESKRDMRKRLHYSPDAADAVAYLLHGAVSLGLNIYDPDKRKRDAEQRNDIRRFALSGVTSSDPYVSDRYDESVTSYNL